jgi:phosphate transporter
MHEVVEASAPFTAESRAKISDAITRLADFHDKCVIIIGDKPEALQQLKLYQREHMSAAVGAFRNGDGVRERAQLSRVARSKVDDVRKGYIESMADFIM